MYFRASLVNEGTIDSLTPVEDDTVTIGGVEDYMGHNKQLISTGTGIGTGISMNQ